MPTRSDEPPDYLELPEECPQCQESNSDKDGYWACPGHEPFCSVNCQEDYQDAEYEATERKVLADRLTSEMIEGRNQKCPLGLCLSYKKFCYHQETP